VTYKHLYFTKNVCTSRHHLISPSSLSRPPSPTTDLWYVWGLYSRCPSLCHCHVLTQHSVTSRSPSTLLELATTFHRTWDIHVSPPCTSSQRTWYLFCLYLLSNCHVFSVFYVLLFSCSAHLLCFFFIYGALILTNLIDWLIDSCPHRRC